MQVDHIEPDGGDDEQNLALSCWNCNNHKRRATQAPDPDPETETLVSLFHPCQQIWSEHFTWIDNSIRLRGRTPSGRATILRLKMNRPAIVIAQKRWVDAGYLPPSLNDG